jgi:DNA-binding transcriptional ArsR family regulator
MNMNSYSCCSKDTKKSTDISSLSLLLKVVGEENRLKILCILHNGSHCVCEIEKHVRLSQSLISHHLKDLKIAGLIIDEKKGLSVYYSLTEVGKRIVISLFSLERGNT